MTATNTILNSVLVALGAGDHEMNTIETVLRAIGAKFVHAVNAKGERVAPSQAYNGAEIRLAPGVDPVVFDTIVLVECRPALDQFRPDARVVVCDHHNPGDPGFGVGPEDFFWASSIGQVICFLAGADALPPTWEVAEIDDPAHKRGDFLNYGHPYGWYVSVGHPHAVAIPQDIVLAAAGDHCPEAAYRGKCPGVNPDALMAWRIARTVEFRNSVRKPGEPEIKAEDVLRAASTARNVLRTAAHGSGDFYPDCTVGEKYEINGRVATITGSWTEPDAGGVEVPCASWRYEYADLRHTHVPELPEAALREGIPFLSRTVDRGTGRNKVGLMAAPPDLVKRFMAGKLVPGLTGIYGDPARGFAGGYET